MTIERELREELSKLSPGDLRKKLVKAIELQMFMRPYGDDPIILALVRLLIFESLVANES